MHIFSETSEAINLSSQKIDSIFVKLFHSESKEWEKIQILLGIASQIPEILILQYGTGEDYLFILRKNVQIPQHLQKILDDEDNIIKCFELIKQQTLLVDQTEEELKGEELRIQWIITDSSKKYWTKYKNSIFEYGKGFLDYPSIIISTTTDEILNYFHDGHPTLRNFKINGSFTQITKFERIRERAFSPYTRPLVHDIEELLLATIYTKNEKEKQQLRRVEEERELKRIQAEKERELKRKEALKKEQERELLRKKREELYKKIVSHFEELAKIYEEIKIKDLKRKISNEIQEDYEQILNKSFLELIEEMIMKKEIYARIRGENLAFLPRADTSPSSHLMTHQEILKRIKKMMEVSNQINLEMMRSALNMDNKEFNLRIFDWASKFGFTIDGDYLTVKREMISDFIDKLNKLFDEWGKKEGSNRKTL
ncbi:MAG: hypothetical protein ACFFDC_01050 [Promethearchaeota archaeon]